MIKEGGKAPNFKLTDDSGKEIQLKDFKGKNIVLYFYPKDNTPGCTQESCDFRDNVPALIRKDTVVLGVSADSVSSHQNFKMKFNLPFPLISDPEKEMIKDYGVWQKKSMYGKSYMGIVRTTVVIDKNQRIIKIFSKVKVKGHVEEVLAALN